LITNSDLIILANYIKDLQEENINLSNQVKVLENSLNSEREKTKETIEEKNKLISNLEDQIKNYKKIESYNSLSII
jgi:sugar-specific transcriptional regulator TrmB